ncbi:E3 ubiquitin-protein ligase CHIP-like [Hordeum vulgare]|nr:E3 ubiquitin-protein ligase CHIP-like [Hordeum vulgare]
MAAAEEDGGSGVARQAELRRAEGNACFRKARLGAAIDCYTEASARTSFLPQSPSSSCSRSTIRSVKELIIECKDGLIHWFGFQAIALCPGVAVYWVNRGLCHFRRKDWARVEEDSRRALALDDASVKVTLRQIIQISHMTDDRFQSHLVQALGHYLLGCALLEKEDCALAVKEFDKALDLLKSSSSRDKMAEDIWQVLAKAKYLDWEKHSTQRVWKMQSLREACENALQEHHFLSGTLSEDSDGRTNEYSEQCKLLSEVFTNAILADTPGDVPDYLCCQITFEIFRDPVITPSGVTYERTILLEHLRKVGNFDPVTREPLKEHQLVPNLAIKEAVQAYLKEHSWAYKLN